MKKNILLLIIIAVFGFNAFGQNKPFDELTFSLTPLRPQVLPLEEIPFKLTLANNTDTPITVETALSFSWGGLRLEIRKPNGNIVVPSQNSYLNGRMFIFPKDIPPGESMESTQIFEFRLQQYFGRMGHYQVRAILNNKNGKTVRSEWVNLAVVEPTSTDKDAYEFLKRKLDKHPDSPGTFVGWSPEELEKFVLLHPGTTYANYVRYSLGQIYEMSREYEKAEAQFRQIQDPNFLYAREVSEKLKNYIAWGCSAPPAPVGLSAQKTGKPSSGCGCPC